MSDEKPLSQEDIEETILGYHRGTPEQLQQTVQQLKDGGGMDGYIGQEVGQLLNFLQHIFG